MTTKKTGIKCYDNAADDEPLFVLRAVDPATPEAIRAWANEANGLGHRADKVREAMNYADEIEAWQKAHPERMKVPN